MTLASGILAIIGGAILSIGLMLLVDRAITRGIDEGIIDRSGEGRDRYGN